MLVPERRRLFPFMNVLENLEVGAYCPAARSVARKTLDEVLNCCPCSRIAASRSRDR